MLFYFFAFLSLTIARPSLSSSRTIFSNVKVNDLNRNALSVVLSHLNLPEMQGARLVCTDTRNAMDDAIKIQDRDILQSLTRHFVTIPAGKLPGNIEIATFEAAQYPVTRKQWKLIMGEMPSHVSEGQRSTWNSCPNCPVTYVNWENQDGSRAEVQDFLEKLNQREVASGCTYDLPADKQLWYTIRGDETGLNQDLYSKGFTSQNVGEYVTHRGNSNQQIQSVGQKKLNAFGIELGNVWKMSKELYSQGQPAWGRSVRGGGWADDVSGAGSGSRHGAAAGRRSDDVGLALVRTCP